MEMALLTSHSPAEPELQLSYSAEEMGHLLRIRLGPSRSHRLPLISRSEMSMEMAISTWLFRVTPETETFRCSWAPEMADLFPPSAARSLLLLSIPIAGLQWET